MADASFLKGLRNKFLGTKETNIAAAPQQSRILGRGSRKAAAVAAPAASAVPAASVPAAVPAAAAPAAIQKNNRSFTQKVKNRLFGRPAPVHVAAPVAAPAATTGYEDLIVGIKTTQELQLDQETKDTIIKQYIALKKSIDIIIEERGKLIQKEKEYIDNEHKGDHIVARIIDEIKRIKIKINQESQQSESSFNDLSGILRAKKVVIQSVNTRQEMKGYIIFTLRLPSYLKNIDELILYLNENNDELQQHRRIELLNLQIKDVDEETHIRLLNELSEKVNTLDLSDDSDTIRQEMNEAIALFNTNFDFLEELKEIKRIRNKMYDMNESLRSENLNYSYRKTKKHEFNTIEEHKNKIREVLRAVTEKDKDNEDIRIYTESDINLFLKRRGQYDDVEEILFIDFTESTDHSKGLILEKLLKIANYMGGFYDFRIYGISVTDAKGNLIRKGSLEYSKRINDAIDEVVKDYINKVSIDKRIIGMEYRNELSGLRSAMTAQKKTITKDEENKEVVKSIIVNNKNLTLYRLQELLSESTELTKVKIDTIYDNIEQEDMDKVNKEEAARKEIDTVDKALAFAKGFREYTRLRRKKLTEKEIEDKQELIKSYEDRIKELTNRDEIASYKKIIQESAEAIKLSQSMPALEKKFGDEVKYEVAKERLRRVNLWPETLEQATAYINKHKEGMNEADSEYFILKMAEGVIARAEAEAEAAAAAAPYPQTKNNADHADQVDDDRCLLAPDKRPNLVDESYQDAYNRVLVFLYHKMKQTPIDPPNKYQLTPEEEKELMESVLKFGHEHEVEEMALELFHTPIDTLSTEIHIFELNDPNRPRSRDPTKHKRILDKGTDHQRCSLSLAGGFYRLISLMRHNGRQANYMADYSTHVCDPLTQDCITVINNKEIYDEIQEGKTDSYIIVNPEYFPVVSSIPINILYSRIPLQSFLIDAFLNKGILEIESKLKARMEKDYPELFYINVKESNAEKMLLNAILKKIKTKRNYNATWLTNRNKSKRKKADENAERDLDLAKARLEITKAAAQMKMNLNIKKRNQGSKEAARASIENNIRKMNQEQTKKGLLKRKKVEFPGPAPPALKPGSPFVAVSGAPAVAVSGAPAVAVSGAPAVAVSGAPAAAVSGAPAVAVSGAPAVVFPPRPKGPRPVTASTPGLPGGPVAPPRVPKPNNLIKAAAADIRRALIERNYSNINKNQNTRKGLLRRKRLNFPDPALRVRPPGHKPKNLINAADVRARAAAGVLPLGLPPKPQWVINARTRASTHGGPATGVPSASTPAAVSGAPPVVAPGSGAPAIVKHTFPGLVPEWEENNNNNNNWDDEVGPESNKVHEISMERVLLPPGGPAAGVPGAAVAPGPPAPGHPGGPPAPVPRQPTAASRNNSPKNIKTRIGTIRQKFAEAKAKINAFKARPKTKAKGGSRTRKLKSRR